MKTFKTRHQFYLPDDLSDELDKLSRQRGASKTQVMTEALRRWIDRKEINELDERFAPRLDRQQRHLQRIETTLNIAAEVIDVLVAHQMTLTAHQPAFDPETARLGRVRYGAFMDKVARQLGKAGGTARLSSISKGNRGDG